MKNKMLLGLMLISIPLVYLIVIYNSLPQLVSMDYNLNGEAGDKVPKSQVFILTAGLSLLTLIVLLLLSLIHKLSPKMSPVANSKRMQNIALLVTGFLVFVQCWLIHIFQYGIEGSTLKLLLIAMGILFALIGNYFPNLKPNYVAGYRTPWSLKNADNWRKTHNLAGKVWFFGGLIMCFLSILLPFKIAFIVSAIAFLCLLIIPGVYSYRLYKKGIALVF